MILKDRSRLAWCNGCGRATRAVYCTTSFPHQFLIFILHPPLNTYFSSERVVEDGGGWEEDLALVVEDAFRQWRALET
jgi:hypothetical protein